MNEQEINLIREYTIIHYLIKEAVVEIENLKTARISLRNLLIFATKATGTKLREKLRLIDRELRSMKIHVWFEDDGGEVIYVCTSKNMVKGRNGIKRRVLREDMEKRLDDLCGEFMTDHEVTGPYKVKMDIGDPYAGHYK